MVADMNAGERAQHGIPVRYSDYDTSCTREEIERYYRLREEFMANRLLKKKGRFEKQPFWRRIYFGFAVPVEEELEASELFFSCPFFFLWVFLCVSPDFFWL